MVDITRRQLLQAGAAVGGLLLVGACSDEAAPPTEAPDAVEAPTLDELVTASQSEGGDMLWYLPGQADTAKALQDGFKAAYPWTNARVENLTFRDLPNKLITEAITQAPTADVFMLPRTFRETMLQNEVVVPVKLPADDAMPQDLLDPEPYSHPCYILLISMIYNTNALPGGPPDPKALATPAWSKKLAFDRVQSLGQSTIWLSSWRNQWGSSDWVKWLDGLKANEVFITATGGDTYAAVLRGERPIGFGSSNDINAQAPGTPMAADYTIPPVPFIQNLWLTKNAAHPATGKLFMNWALSEDGQKAFAATGRSPALQTIDSPISVTSLLPPETKLLSGAELQDFYASTGEYLSILGAKWPG